MGGQGSGSGRHRESKSGAIAMEAAVTRADVRSPPPPAGSLIKGDALFLIFFSKKKRAGC